MKKLRQPLDKNTPTPGQIAAKHGVSKATVNAAIKAGSKVEREHTTHADVAREIATDHVAERPDYYKRLKKVEGN